LNARDLFTRAGAGIIYILLILLGVLGGRTSFLIVFGTILAIGLFEFYRMVEKDTTHAISKIFNISMGILLFLSVFLFIEGIFLFALPVGILVYLMILFTSSVFLRRQDILHGIIYSVFGQIYVTMPLGLLMLLSYSYQSNLSGEGHHWAPILALFVFIWINDTAAYFIGSLIGKHKLIEHISPKKSVEGFIAGILFTLLASFFFSKFYPEYSTAFWMGYAAVVALFGTLGDLFESLIKRTCGVKDAGNLIPGHGGILDRIDSLLVAVPAAYLYLLIFLSF
jgi:phosphatidate cytidylyltransferase